MKKIYLLAFVLTLLSPASHAQSLGDVLNAVADAISGEKKDEWRNKVIDAGGQVGLSVPKDVLHKDITYWSWSVSDLSKLRIVSNDKSSCVIKGISSTSSSVVTYKYYYKVMKDGKEDKESRTITYNIKVNQIVPTSLSVLQETTVGWGTYAQLRPILKPDYSEAALEYTSENTDIVRVGTNGKIYGVAMGDTYVTIRSDNGLETETHVTVGMPSISEIKITGYDKNVKLYDGDQLQLGYTYAPEHAEPQVRWQSSDSHIATVDENGLVTFVSNGTVHIYCIDRTGVKADIKLKPKKNKNK